MIADFLGVDIDLVPGRGIMLGGRMGSCAGFLVLGFLNRFLLG